MPDTLLRHAMEQSREREPAVMAMVLLHAARVLAAVDWPGSKRVYAEGCAAVAGLTLNPRTLDMALCEAVKLGASVDAQAAVALFRGLPAHGDDMVRDSAARHLVQTLAQDGELQIAVEVLEDLSCPVGGAMVVVHLTPDLALQRRAMAAARERWRLPRQPGPRFDDREFILLFSFHWQKLEPVEQLRWLEEILQSIAAEAQTPTSAGHGEVTLHTIGDSQLFDILHGLRALKPADEVESILRAHPDVAKAAEIYPLGMESLRAQARAAASDQPSGTGGGIIMAGGGGGRPGDRSLMEAMMKARRGDPSGVSDLMAEALRRFREDKDPESANSAPIAFWPSCRAYQSAMYWAGKTSGMDGAARLAEIPDTDLALFGAIELAAGVLDLPEYSGVRIGPPRRRPPGFFGPPLVNAPT